MPTSHLPCLYKKRLYGLFLGMLFNFIKATKPQRGGSLLFATKFAEISGTQLIDLGTSPLFWK